MIAKLSGRVDSTGEDWVVIDVGGVGYLLTCSARTLRALPGAGEAVAVLVETRMTEERIDLYGFRDRLERDWFRLLQTVQGVGARVALALLSVLEPDALARAVAAQDKTALQRANGVGARLAQRIAMELKDRVPADIAFGAPAAAQAPGAVPPAGSAVAVEAVSALVNLGYRQAEAGAAVARALAGLGEDASVAAVIRAGLKDLAR